MLLSGNFLLTRQLLIEIKKIFIQSKFFFFFFSFFQAQLTVVVMQTVYGTSMECHNQMTQLIPGKGGKPVSMLYISSGIIMIHYYPLFLLVREINRYSDLQFIEDI